MPTRARLRLAGVCLAVAGLTGGAPAQATPTPQAATTAPPLPASLASAGDSITRAFDVGSCCIFRDATQHSWSTGSGSAVLSHYRRILARNPAIAGRVTNRARTGAKMADLDSQLRLVAGDAPGYVTVLMGANDVCTPTIATMTSVKVFEGQVRAALAHLATARPTARVLVASIPNIYRLWSVLHTNPSARNTWARFDICQSMLDPLNTEAQRQTVLTRERALNSALARVCAEFTRCRWDGLATFGVAFTAADVSTVDYFHPSFTGQNRIAAVTWAAGYWSAP